LSGRFSLKAPASLALASVCAILLWVAPAASAAEFGSGCQANLRSVGFTALQTSTSGAPLITSERGVVTGWAVENGGFNGVAEKLKVFKPVGAEFEVVTETAAEQVPKATRSVFPTRISVPAGVQFGAFSSGGVPVCIGDPSAANKYSTFGGDVAIGNKAKPTFTEGNATVALAVRVEPDADGDGFGDESQDACPTNATTQGTCPPAPPPTTGGGPGGGGAATLGLGLKAKLEGNMVAVQVTGSDKATVAVSDLFRGRKVAGPKSANVGPGQPGRVYLPLSELVKEKLAKLPRKRKLTLVIEAKGQSSAGASAATSIELALPGRKKPPRHHRSRH
jgi:hypothetical protein